MSFPGISANANSEGVKPKVSPLAQNNSNGGSSSPSVQTPQTPVSGGPPPPPPAPPMGSLAMGMPFQVFPTGPPVKNNQQLSAPKTNGNNRKSPQSFDPPPMGCRPEIKIPENPMALLRSVPKPRPKSDFWMDEYVQEKTGEPEKQERQEVSSSPSIQQQQQQYQQEYRPSPPVQKQVSPPRFAERTPSPPERRDFRNVRLENMRTASPVQIHRSSPVASPSPAPSSVTTPVTPIKTITIEPVQSYKQPTQSQQPQQSYQQPKTSYQQPQPSYQQTQPSYQQPTQSYQQPTLSFQPLQQPTQQQPSQGGRIILSTMPNKQRAEAQQQVSDFT